MSEAPEASLKRSAAARAVVCPECKAKPCCEDCPKRIMRKENYKAWARIYRKSNNLARGYFSMKIDTKLLSDYTAYAKKRNTTRTSIMHEALEIYRKKYFLKAGIK